MLELRRDIGTQETVLERPLTNMILLFLSPTTTEAWWPTPCTNRAEPIALGLSHSFFQSIDSGFPKHILTDPNRVLLGHFRHAVQTPPIFGFQVHNLEKAKVYWDFKRSPT